MHAAPRNLSTLAIATLALLATAASAATPEQLCQAARYRESAKYRSCQDKSLFKWYVTQTLDKPQEAFDKCTAKYAGKWAKLNAKYPGTTCDQARFTDNGDGTVTDNLTALRWEKKTADASVHDHTNWYTWTSASMGTTANGTAFTSFLDTLNGTCFAGHCDWRLPSIGELGTIVTGAYLSCADPCIDPIFGPITTTLSTWSSTTDPAEPDAVWDLDFSNAELNASGKFNLHYVRAVRAGL